MARFLQADENQKKKNNGSLLMNANKHNEEQKDAGNKLNLCRRLFTKVFPFSANNLLPTTSFTFSLIQDLHLSSKVSQIYLFYFHPSCLSNHHLFSQFFINNWLFKSLIFSSLLQFIFMTNQHLYFILGIILFSNLCVFVNNATFNMHVTCHPCSKPCAFENCLRYSAGGYDEEYCGEASCDIRTSSTINVTTCNYDYAGKQCQSKICLRYSKQDEGQICASRKYSVLMNKTCSGKNSNLAFRCTTCSGVNNIGSDGQNQTCTANKCFSGLYGPAVGSPGSFEDCIGSTCNGVTEQPEGLTIKYVSCKADRFGLPCSCCFSQVNTQYEMRQCLDDVGFYNNEKLANFKKFVQYELNKPVVKGSERIKLVLGSLLVFLLMFS